MSCWRVYSSFDLSCQSEENLNDSPQNLLQVFYWCASSKWTRLCVEQTNWNYRYGKYNIEWMIMNKWLIVIKERRKWSLSIGSCLPSTPRTLAYQLIILFFSDHLEWRQGHKLYFTDRVCQCVGSSGVIQSYICIGKSVGVSPQTNHPQYHLSFLCIRPLIEQSTSYSTSSLSCKLHEYGGAECCPNVREFHLSSVWRVDNFLLR